ncbi:MAG: serine hydrolase [Candidatus Cyclobacteriaceae bacterium M2_1C_046]
MKKYLIIPALICLFYLNAFSQSKKDYSEAYQLIEVWLEAQKDFEQLPGITAIVVDDQEVLWKKGFGLANKEQNIEADPSTLFSICSISKLFTTVAIMKLYDEGKLRLDDNINDLLPWYNLQQQFPESGPVTIRSLLTHSSGLPREAGYPYWTGPEFPFPTAEQVQKKLGEQETLYPSSTFFQYSNLAMTLLGEIVEEVSGQSYDDYINQHILEPLQLNNTRTELPEDLYGSQLAIGYGAISRELERNKVKLFQAEGIKAAAGFSSNVEDLASFASWNFRLLDTTSAEILKPSTLNYMQRVHWTDPNWQVTWGLGYSVRKDNEGNTVVGHGGSCPGYRSSLSMYPKDKMAYVVMINAGGTNPGKYINGIRGIMSKVKGKTEEAKANLQEYTGRYSSQPWWSELYVGAWEGKLVTMSLPSDSPAGSMTFFKHIEGDTFRRLRDDGELGEALNFVRDKNNNVVRLERHGNYSDKITE